MTASATVPLKSKTAKRKQRRKREEKHRERKSEGKEKCNEIVRKITKKKELKIFQYSSPKKILQKKNDFLN